MGPILFHFSCLVKELFNIELGRGDFFSSWWFEEHPISVFLSFRLLYYASLTHFLLRHMIMSLSIFFLIGFGRDLQGNKLSGQIPDEIGNCISLITLYDPITLSCFFSLNFLWGSLCMCWRCLYYDLHGDSICNAGICPIICCMGTYPFRFRSLRNLSCCKWCSHSDSWEKSYENYLGYVEQGNG